MPQAVFLMYHDISNGVSNEIYTVSQESFRSQLERIAESGAVTQTVREFVEAPADRAVVITFDDGNASNLHVAAPLMRGYGFQGTFFVTTGFIGVRKNFMTWPEVGQLAESGMEIGSHGHTHRFLTDLDGDDLTEEVLRPKVLLQENLGLHNVNMSAPGGRVNKAVSATIRSHGYSSLSTSRPCINHVTGARALEFGRFPITQNTTEDDLLRILSFDTMYARRKTIIFNTKQLAKSIVGNQRYQRFWNRKMR